MCTYIRLSYRVPNPVNCDKYFYGALMKAYLFTLFSVSPRNQHREEKINIVLAYTVAKISVVFRQGTSYLNQKLVD